MKDVVKTFAHTAPQSIELIVFPTKYDPPPIVTGIDYRITHVSLLSLISHERQAINHSYTQYRHCHGQSHGDPDRSPRSVLPNRTAHSASQM